MQIISIEGGKDPETEELISIYIWIDDNRNYKHYRVTPDNYLEEMNSINKSDYKNYIHFVNIMGKFNPWTIFLVDPIPITEINFDQLDKILIDVKKMMDD